MSVIDELAIARFNKTDDPKDSRPLDAIEAAKEFILGEGKDTHHVIVLLGRDMPDGSSGTRYFQSGSFRHHSVMGLCTEGMHMMRESG